jgi:hypothetical protein
MPRIGRPRRVVPESVKALVEALGGVAALSVMFDLSPQAICNWIAQDAIPARYHAVFLMITEREGLYWRPPGWDPDVQLRYRPEPAETEEAA